MSWYAIYTKPRHEKKIHAQLTDKDIETFLPLVTRKRQWKDRKKNVEIPLFSSYLFVNFEYKYRFDVLETDGVVKIVNFNGVPAVVPDWQIESLKQMLTYPKTLQLENYIQPGEIVEVTEGPMQGMCGTVIIRKNSNRLVLTIEGIMQSISVEVDEFVLKKVKDNDK
ncbi:MAG: UpxY family transcription antiterminator, partial [Calditrichia bacterium]|nr:UpxY family transcription antiterminator [Calditrichia bacterium]